MILQEDDILGLVGFQSGVEGDVGGDAGWAVSAGEQFDDGDALALALAALVLFRP